MRQGGLAVRLQTAQINAIAGDGRRQKDKTSREGIPVTDFRVTATGGTGGLRDCFNYVAGRGSAKRRPC